MKLLFHFFAILMLTCQGQTQELTQSHRDAFARCRKLQETGDWLAAREVAHELVSFFSGAAPSQHRLAFTNELANLEQRLGKYGESLTAYEECLVMASELQGADSAIAAQIQNNLAALHQVLGDFQAAEELNRNALAIREQREGKGSVGTVPAMNNLAGLLWCIGDLGGAESLYRDALAIRTQHLGADALDTARSRANLGGLLYYRKEILEATTLVKAAVEVFLRESGPTHPDTLEVILFLGEIERAGGRPAAALALYTQALDGRVSSLGTRDHVEVAEALRRIGDSHRELGQYPAAREAYLESDAIYQRVLRADHPDRQEGLYGLGLTALASGDTNAAVEAARTCAEVEFRQFDAMLQFTDERQRLAYQDKFKSHHLFANLGDARAIEEFLLRQKGIVSDSLVAESQLSKHSTDPVIETARRSLAEARAQYRTAYLGGGSTGTSIPELESLVRDTYRGLLTATGAKDLFPVTQNTTLASLQSSLAENEVLLDYLRYDRYSGEANFETRYGVVLVTRSRVEFFDCCEAAETDGVISAMVSFFGAGEEIENANETARKTMATLHRDLLSPLESSFPPNASILICPESTLSFVPFACLVGKDGRFFVEQHDLRYLSSAREIIRKPVTVDPSRGAFLVGNPVFKTGAALPDTGIGDRRGLLASFSATGLANLAEFIEPLEGTELEVNLLGPILRDTLHSPVKSLKGLDASESNLRSGVDRPYLLHVATHGVYLPSALEPVDAARQTAPFVPEEIAGFQNPMFGSWLALAGSGDTVAAWSRGIVPDPMNDGVLMANEVAEFDLEGTLLIVLSACDTATGEATSGDGVLGIRRGFRMAGAENIVSTLWPISDVATVDIMEEFYTGIPQAGVGGALSATQRKWLVAIRDKTEPMQDDPLPVNGFYWAVNLAGPFLLGR